MTFMKLIRGTQISVDGVNYTVARRTTDGCVVLDDTQKCLAPKTLSDKQIAVMVHKGTAEFVAPGSDVPCVVNPEHADFTQLSKELKETAYLRRLYVLKALTVTVPSCKTVYANFINKIATEIGDAGTPPSRATLFRWIRRWLIGGGKDIRTLVPGFSSRGNRNSRMDEEVDDIVGSAIDAIYYRPERLTICAVHNAVATLEQMNKDLPSDRPQYQFPTVRTIGRRIKAEDQYWQKRARFGKRAANEEFRPVGAAPAATRPLQVIEIDHTPIDGLLLNEEGALLGRPWLTVAIDRYTRMVVGFYVTFDPPNANSVLLCLRHAILEKSYISEAFADVENEWLCYGIPEWIVVDNGPEFHSEALTDACAQLGISIQYCPRRQPWYKGKVERWFRTVGTGLIHQLPGTTRSNVADRGDYESELRASIAFDDFILLLHMWIIDVYCRAPHAGIRDIPERLWKLGVSNHPVTYIKRIEDLDPFIGGFEIRTPRHIGVELHGLCYNSEELGWLRRRGNAPKEVKVRFDPADLSEIRVMDPATGTYFTVPCVDDYAKGLSLAQHKAIRAQLAKQVEGYLDINQLCITRDNLRKKWESLMRDPRKKTRKHTSRLVGGLNSSTATKRATIKQSEDLMGELPSSLSSVKSGDVVEMNNQNVVDAVEAVDDDTFDTSDFEMKVVSLKKDEK